MENNSLTIECMKHRLCALWCENNNQRAEIVFSSRHFTGTTKLHKKQRFSHRTFRPTPRERGAACRFGGAAAARAQRHPRVSTCPSRRLRENHLPLLLLLPSAPLCSSCSPPQRHTLGWPVRKLGSDMGETVLPRRMFLWCMALIYLAAFVSLYVQIPGETAEGSWLARAGGAGRGLGSARLGSTLLVEGKQKPPGSFCPPLANFTS